MMPRPRSAIVGFVFAVNHGWESGRISPVAKHCSRAGNYPQVLVEVSFFKLPQVHGGGTVTARFPKEIAVVELEEIRGSVFTILPPFPWPSTLSATDKAGVEAEMGTTWESGLYTRADLSRALAVILRERNVFVRGQEAREMIVPVAMPGTSVVDVAWEFRELVLPRSSPDCRCPVHGISLTNCAHNTAWFLRTVIGNRLQVRGFAVDCNRGNGGDGSFYPPKNVEEGAVTPYCIRA